MYIKIDTKEILSERQIRALFPEVSLPAAFVAPEGFAEFKYAATPKFDSYIEKCVEGEPVPNEDGSYSQAWNIVPLDVTPEQVLQKKYASLRTRLTAHGDKLLKDFARANEYENINTMVSYKDSGVEEFRTIGDKAFKFRDAVWSYLRVIDEASKVDMAAYAAGEKVPPTYEAIIEGFPKPEDIV